MPRERLDNDACLCLSRFVTSVVMVYDFFSCLRDWRLGKDWFIFYFFKYIIAHAEFH